MIKQFYCGLCKEDKRIAMTRLALRKHLSDEHSISYKKFNSDYVKGKGYDRQNWIIEVEKE